MTGSASSLYRLVVDEEEEHGRGELPEDAYEQVPGNALKLIGALTLQKIGDRIVDAKTVLAWLFAALGVPAALTGLLVPIRESGSLLPQAALVPWVRTFPRRGRVWMLGAVGQFLAVMAMAGIAAGFRGTTAGLAILGALAMFALSRSLTSIASKDVLGRTVPKGERGQVNGLATVTSGLVAIGGGVLIGVIGGATDPRTFAWLLVGGAAMWLAALAVFATVREPEGAHDASLDVGRAARALGLLRRDRPFRRFVIARTLLLVSALTPPFVVTLATTAFELDLGVLGPFVVAQGLASLLGGRVWGRWADRSSRRVIIAASGIGAALVVAFLAARSVPVVRESVWLYPLTYFLLALTHTGARIGRKTYVVDLAEGNRRTDYVAVANTAMGVLLLVTGAVSAGLAQIGPEVAIGFLALLGAVGVPVARTLPEVSAP